MQRQKPRFIQMRFDCIGIRGVWIASELRSTNIEIVCAIVVALFCLLDGFVAACDFR